MASFSLDQIKAAADAKYGSLEVDINENTSVVLVNALQLPKAKRDELKSIQDKSKAEDSDTEALITEVILCVAKDGRGQVLLDAVGDNLALLMEIFNEYNGQSQVGEA